MEAFRECFYGWGNVHGKGGGLHWVIWVRREQGDSLAGATQGTKVTAV